MIDSVVLRPLEESDLEFLCDVRHHPDTLPFLHDPRSFSIEEVRHWFVTEDPEWLIVEHDGARVGYIRIADKDLTARRIKIGMDIHPAVRRQGLAFAAYQHLFQRLLQGGWKTVWLEVLSHNHAARELYEKLGFRYLSNG